MFHDIDRNVRYASVQKFGNKRTPLASTGQFVKLTEDSAAREDTECVFSVGATSTV